MNGNVRKLIDKVGEFFYPLTVAKAVYHSNGKQVETILDEHTSSLAEITKNKADWFNVAKNGIDNTGTVDIGNALNTLLAAHDEEVICIPKGVYTTSIPIQIKTKLSIILDPFAIIRATAPMESLIQYGYGITTGNFGADSIIGQFIIGGTLDCNNLANNGIEFGNCYNCFYEKSYILNFLKKGIKVSASDTFGSSNGVKCKGILMRNFSAVNGCYGVYDNGSDNVFESIITVDIETGFYTEGRDTKFTSCHSWISMQSLIPTSTFAEVHGDTAVFDNPRIDTMRYGFKLYNTHTRIINAHMLWNLSVYTSAYQSSQPIFIKCEQQTIYEYVHAVNTEIVANAAHLNVRVKNKTSNLDKFVNTNLVTGGLGTFDKASYYEYGTYYGAGTITAQNGFTIDATSYVKSNDARKKGEFYLYATATATNPDWIVPCNVSVKPTATVRVQGFSITNNGVSFYGTLNNTGDLAILHGFAVGEKFWLKVEYDIA